MGKNIFFATQNSKKIKEAREILEPLGFIVVTPKDLGIDIDPVEDANTFEGNAMIKASVLAEYVKDMIIIAEDSGFCISCKNGAPGIFSRRFIYENAGGDEELNIRKILKEIEHSTDRTATYITCIAIIMPNGKQFFATGELPGIIPHEPQGENSVGYDRIMYVPELGKTVAEMSCCEKHSISHRAKALKAAVDLIISEQSQQFELS